MLKDKNILMFSNAFFDYEKIIAEKLALHGANVDFYDERPSNSFFIKGIIRVRKKVLKKRIENYYKTILKNIKEKKYDIFFLIKGEVVPAFFIKELKVQNPNIKLFYYNYDSFHNNPNALQILPLFDLKYTFDYYDAEKYNLNFRPLFYSDIYKNVREGNNKSKIMNDVIFIGTAHSDRYIIAEEVKKQLKRFGRTAYTYYFIQGKLVYWYKKIFDSSFSKFEYKKLSFNKLDHLEIIKLYQESRCILDINHPNQTGLTMRTFEALGAGKKLITTNSEILKYKFYHPNNILVIDRENIKIEESFFNSSICDIFNGYLYNMSLDGWIEDIFFHQCKNNYLR